MAFKGLYSFIEALEEKGELQRIKTLVSPELEITEITDRISKAGGKALLFENTGTDFPVLINLFGSVERMSLAIGRENLEEAGKELEQIYKKAGGKSTGLWSKIKMIPYLSKLVVSIPKKLKKKGACQQVILPEPDLGKLPVLKCWPHDGGPFITLPVVHTKNPVTGEVNAGMYRMQVSDKTSTGMHWHRHKTGARHYSEYKRLGKKMPVVVTLGGDPVYTYSATAPMPEGMDEYMLAGFLRSKRVNMVKCITQDLWVPEDVDFVIEGYVDPSEDLMWEGPFGDHTGFYSLADWYPKFHVTAITHRQDAVYPATIVGIPPQEDAVIGLATERLFLYPVKLALQQDVVDFHLPAAGVAHNLVLVKIDKEYPGQGMKVINALFGAGQMMFSKFIVVVDKDADLRNYRDIARRVTQNCDLEIDMLLQTGPLDILDHSSDTFSYGGKMGLDATCKHTEEIAARRKNRKSGKTGLDSTLMINGNKAIKWINHNLLKDNIPAVFIGIDKTHNWKEEVENLIVGTEGLIVFVLDNSTDMNDYYQSCWQILSNTDPVRDISRIAGNLIINSSAKSHSTDNFPRSWPNVVVSDKKTIEDIDSMWDRLDLGKVITSPSVKFSSLLFDGEAEISK
jgi:4-hydroxy-3-polyprenylbenzoate decarboxylase